MASDVTIAATPPLPPLLAEIEDAAGREVALAIGLALGGQSVAIPKPPHVAKSKLAARIGKTAALALAKVRPGETISIPKGRAALIHWLVIEQGRSWNEAAERTGCDRSTVAKTVRQLREGGQQPSLFDWIAEPAP